MAEVNDNFWESAVNLILGPILPSKTDAKTPPPPPLASAPAADVMTPAMAGIKKAQLAADRAIAATAAAAEAVARARAEAEARAEAATTAPFKKLRFAVPEATYAEEAARVEAEARARAGASAGAGGCARP